MMTTCMTAHKSMLVGLLVHAPGVRVAAVAFTVPVFCKVMVEATDWPGDMAKLPPYLLMVAQVAALLVPSVEVQVTVAPVESLPVSCMTKEPAPAVLLELVMDAV